MGLIKALTGSAVSYIADMWQDYIYCDSLDENTLIRKGHAKRSPGAGNNADDNIITDGSRIAVNPGQMLIVTENGMIVDFTAEPGGYEFNSSASPSMFCGDFGDPLRTAFEGMKERFAYGGIAAADQRAYFVNIKEMTGNKFGFGNVPYRDAEFNMTVLLQGFGTYSFTVADPITFYTNVCGNVAESYSKSKLLPQLKGEIQNAMLPVLGELAEKGVHYDKLSMRTDDITALLKENLSRMWREERGLEIKSLTFSTILPDDESMDKIRELQESRAYAGNRAMLGARVGAAQASAMESAAENSAGAVTGFMGMNMARQSGSVNVNELMREPTPAPPPAEETWTCSCGMVNTMNFCPKCGSRKPEKPKCQGCGFVFPDGMEGMNFCPKCGKPVQ